MEENDNAKKIPKLSCDICEYTGRNNVKTIKTPCCGNIVCTECIHQWYLQKDVPTCLKCDHVMTQLEVAYTAGAYWTLRTRAYRKHTQKVLFRKMSILQPGIESNLVYLYNNKDIINSILEFATQTRHCMLPALKRCNKFIQTPIQFYGTCISTDDEWDVYTRKVDSLTNSVKHIKEYLRSNDTNVIEESCVSTLCNGWNVNNDDSSVQNNKPVMLFRCSSDSCSGFIMSDTKTCNICSDYYCVECREKVAKDTINSHICDTVTQQTVKDINENSTPCPRCRVEISRKEGCSQMYCILCGQFFDYNTGKPLSGIVHNPEYYDMIKRMGYDIHAENDCMTRLPNMSVFACFTTLYSVYIDTIRIINHAIDNVLPNYNIINPTNKYLTSKIMFHTNQITQNVFERQLRLITSKLTRTTEWGLLLRSMYDSIKSVLLSINKTTTISTIVQTLTNLDEIVQLFVKQADTIKTCLLCKLPDAFDKLLYQYNKMKGHFNVIKNTMIKYHECNTPLASESYILPFDNTDTNNSRVGVIIGTDLIWYHNQHRIYYMYIMNNKLELYGSILPCSKINNIHVVYNSCDKKIYTAISYLNNNVDVYTFSDRQFNLINEMTDKIDTNFTVELTCDTRYVFCYNCTRCIVFSIEAKKMIYDSRNHTDCTPVCHNNNNNKIHHAAVIPIHRIDDGRILFVYKYSNGIRFNTINLDNTITSYCATLIKPGTPSATITLISLTQLCSNRQVVYCSCAINNRNECFEYNTVNHALRKFVIRTPIHSQLNMLSMKPCIIADKYATIKRVGDTRVDILNVYHSTIVCTLNIYSDSICVDNKNKKIIFYNFDQSGETLKFCDISFLY